MNIQQKIERTFENAFERWAIFLARRSICVVISTLLLAIVLIGGFHFQESYNEFDNLWSPEGNKSELNKKRTDELFPATSRSIMLIALSRDSSNIISVDKFKEIGEVENIVQTAEINGIKLSDVCIHSSCRPMISPVLVFSDSNTLDGITTQSELETALKTGINKITSQIIPMSKIMKETTPALLTQNPITGAIADLTVAKSALIFFSIKDTLSDKSIKALELAIQSKIVKRRQEPGLIDFSIYTFSGQIESINQPIDNDLGLMAFSIMLVASYCLFLLGGFSPVNSRILLSLMGLFNIGISYGSACGLLAYMGVKTSKINGILPFLLIGIGADDIFVIVQSVDQISLDYSVAKRVIKGLRHSGPSITITSFTNVMAFFIGATSSLKALSSFCIYTAVGILFLYFYTITFFSALFFMDLQRQRKAKGDFAGLCCCSEKTWFCCWGKILTQQQQKVSQQEYLKVETKEDLKEDVKEEEEENVGQYASQPNHENEVTYSTWVEKFLHKYFSKFLMKTPVRISVLILWLTYTVISIYSITIMKVDFQSDYFIDRKHEAYRFLSTNLKYYQQGLEIRLFIDNDSNDFTSVAYQKEVQAFFNRVNNCEGCSQNWMKSSINSWYSVYLVKSKYYTSIASGNLSPCLNSYDSSNNVIVQDKFYGCLNALIANDALIKQYAGKLKYKDNKIVASQQAFFIKTIKSSSVEGVAFIKDIRKLEESGPNKVYTFNQYYYNFEQYLTFVQESFKSVISSVIVIFIVLLLTTGSLQLSLFVLLSVVMVILFLMSLLPFWDLSLNSITVINVILALGLSVDYSAHIAHSYQICKVPAECSGSRAMARQYKVRGSLKQVGSSVFHGAFSTFLAIIVLAFAQSYGFIVFFKMWFGIILFGVSNGMIFIPVLLSFIGPLNKQTWQDQSVKKNTEQNNDEENNNNVKNLNAQQIIITKSNQNSNNSQNDIQQNNLSLNAENILVHD